ncbi:MAG: hypothetical protein ACLQKA_14095, partial [Bryobacteraceae bacterium]
MVAAEQKWTARGPKDYHRFGERKAEQGGVANAGAVNEHVGEFNAGAKLKLLADFKEISGDRHRRSCRNALVPARTTKPIVRERGLGRFFF